MKLLIDMGNSRVKWAPATGAGIEALHGFDRTGMDATGAYRAAWGDLDPVAVIACSVAGEGPTEELRHWVESRWHRPLTEVRAAARRGDLINAYREPGRLGAERWANLLAARCTLGPADAIVVDAGTAVTVDALRADGHHLGGAILGGLAATRAGLRTAAPFLPPGDDGAALPATTTPTAIGGGTLLALVGGIERVVEAVGADLHAPARVITGGDAEQLLPHLGAGWRHDPLLTMRGLLAAVDD